MKPEDRSVAIIGGGISGLAAAHYLTDAGLRVSLFESSSQLGGLGTFFEYSGTTFERFYHVMLPTDEHLLALLGDIGMADRVYWKPTSLGFFFQGRLFPLNSPLELLRFSPIGILDRLRLGFTALYARHADPAPLDDTTVEDWLTRLSGRRAFDRFWKPLLVAKFGDGYRRVPALWYWTRFNREKGGGQEVKGYAHGGYKGITDALAASLERRGAELRLNAGVERLDLEGDGVVLTVDDRPRRFDRVISTLPLEQLRPLVRGGRVESALARVAHDVEYQGVVNVLVMLRRSISSHYWIACVDSGTPFPGIVETTRAIDLADTGDRHLVYLLNYAHRDDPLFRRDDDDLIGDYLGALMRLVPGVTPDDVIASFVFRAPFVEPLYTPGYSRRKPPTELVEDRIFLATTAQIYPEVTSWNSATGQARRVAGQVADSLDA